MQRPLCSSQNVCKPLENASYKYIKYGTIVYPWHSATDRPPERPGLLPTWTFPCPQTPHNRAAGFPIQEGIPGNTCKKHANLHLHRHACHNPRRGILETLATPGETRLFRQERPFLAKCRLIRGSLAGHWGGARPWVDGSLPNMAVGVRWRAREGLPTARMGNPGFLRKTFANHWKTRPISA